MSLCANYIADLKSLQLVKENENVCHIILQIKSLDKSTTGTECILYSLRYYNCTMNDNENLTRIKVPFEEFEVVIVRSPQIMRVIV